MSFTNVEVKKKANVYHGGKVTSRTVVTSDGQRKSLGVMLPGTYEFNTDAPERMDVTQGRCRVKLASGDWKSYSSGDYFLVPGNSRFTIEVSELLDYVCHFG